MHVAVLHATWQCSLRRWSSFTMIVGESEVTELKGKRLDGSLATSHDTMDFDVSKKLESQS